MPRVRHGQPSHVSSSVLLNAPILTAVSVFRRTQRMLLEEGDPVRNWCLKLSKPLRMVSLFYLSLHYFSSKLGVSELFSKQATFDLVKLKKVQQLFLTHLLTVKVPSSLGGVMG